MCLLSELIANTSATHPEISVTNDSHDPSPSPIYSENSLPPTPKTYTSASDIESIAVVRVGSQKHTGRRTNPQTTTSKPKPNKQANLYLQVKSPDDLERQIVQVSVARQVSVSKARSQVRNALESKQPLRPRVVELNKNRKSTVVLIEGGED